MVPSRLFTFLAPHSRAYTTSTSSSSHSQRRHLSPTACLCTSRNHHPSYPIQLQRGSSHPPRHAIPPLSRPQNAHKSDHIRLHLGPQRHPLRREPLPRRLPFDPILTSSSTISPSPPLDSFTHRRPVRQYRPRLATVFQRRRLLAPPLLHPLVRPIPTPSFGPLPSSDDRPHLVVGTRRLVVVSRDWRRSRQDCELVARWNCGGCTDGKRMVDDQVQGSGEGTLGSSCAESWGQWRVERAGCEGHCCTCFFWPG